MPRERLRVAVFGAGAWGLNHIRVLANDPAWELIAVVDPDARARRAATELAPHAHMHEHADHVLGDREVEAVVISSPSPTHARLACDALASGKHVLIEKPLASSLEEARRVLEAHTRAPEMVAIVGHLMLFHPAVVRLKEMMASDTLGAIKYVYAIRANLGRFRSGENTLWSFGPHDVSVIEYLLEQRAIDVSARGMRLSGGPDEDVVFVTMRFPGDVLAHLHLSWVHPRKERRLTVVGARRLVEFDDVAPEKLKLVDRAFDQPPAFTEFAQYLTMRDGDVHIPTLSMEEPLRLELRHFHACIVEGRRPLSSIASAVGVVATLEAAQQSLRSGGLAIPVTRT